MEGDKTEGVSSSEDDYSDGGDQPEKESEPQQEKTPSSAPASESLSRQTSFNNKQDFKYDFDFLRETLGAEKVKQERYAARKEARRQIKVNEEETAPKQTVESTHHEVFSPDEEASILEILSTLPNLSQENSVFFECVKAVFLSQCAYRVPTGTEFWDIIANIKEGKSRVSVREAFKKYRKKSLASKDVIQAYLKNIALCLGVKFSPLSYTSLSVEVDEVNTALEDEEDRQEDDGDDKTFLKNIEPPKIAPGWLIVQENPTNLWVSIAGTQNPDDSFRDCMFIPTKLRMPPSVNDSEVKTKFLEIFESNLVQVHAGFLDGAFKVFEQVHERVVDALGENSEKITIHIVGHSLGGATALLLAVFFSAWKNRDLKLGKVVTFGAPNVFYTENPSDSEKIDVLLARITLLSFINERDIVPRALGAPLIKKLAKLLIKAGVKALSSLTPENADFLLKYRNVAPKIYYITPPCKIDVITDKDEQKKVLNFGVLDCRPAAGLHHKMGNYISRMLDRLREITQQDHPWNTGDASGGPLEEDVHPIASIIYDKKDPTILSSSFISTVGDIFDDLSEGGSGLSIDSFSMLCFWSKKLYPKHMIHKTFTSGKYENEDGTALTKQGFTALVEDACSSDLPWVSRVIDTMKIKKKDREFFDAEKYPIGEPILEGEGGALSQKALNVVNSIFNMYEKPGTGLWFDCLRTFLTRIDEYETGVAPLPSHITNTAKSILSELRLSTVATASSFDNSNPSNSFLSKAEFAEMLRRWGTEDELRLWQIFQCFDVTADLTFNNSVVNVHGDVEERICLCNNLSVVVPEDKNSEQASIDYDLKKKKLIELTKHIMLTNLNAIMTEREAEEARVKQEERQKKRAKRKPALPRMYQDYIPAATSIVVSPTAANIRRNPEKVRAAMEASNQELERQVNLLKKKIKGVSVAPEGSSETVAPRRVNSEGDHRWLALNAKLRKENENLKQKIAQLPKYESFTAEVTKYQEEIKEKDELLKILAKKHRDLQRLSRTRGDTIMTKEEAQQKITAAVKAGEKETIFLKRQLAKTVAEKHRLTRFNESQLQELGAFPSGTPNINVKLLNQVLEDAGEKDTALTVLRKELSIMQHSSESERKKLDRLVAEQLQQKNYLEKQLEHYSCLLRDKEEQISFNAKATSSRRGIQQGRLRPVKATP